MSAPHHTEARTLRFGVFEVDLGARELRKRGVRMKLQDQPFRVLEALLEKPGEIVTREELKDRLWAHDEFVEFDKSVNTAVQKIRQALGDSAESPRFLETVPRIGYRFVASVSDRDGRVAPEPAPEANPETYERTFARLSWRNALPWALAGSLALFVLWSLRAPDAPIPRPQVRRFTIDPTHTGPGVYSRPNSWRWEDRAAAISPDGSRIAYFSDETPPRLWLHDLSSGESKHVAGAVADEIRNRFSMPGVAWSPRGDALAFRTGGSLAKVGLLDGGVTTLHVADNLASAYIGAVAWSLDGERIFFSAVTGGGARLFAMPAAGGDALPLAVADGWHPTAVPGEGGVLVYQRLGGLEVLRIASGQTSILEENGVNPSWSPTGHILFDREGGIWALPFSSDRLEPEGAPFLVEPGFSNAGVSIDGALLAVTSRVQGQRLRLTIRNRHGRLIRKLGPPLFGDRFRARHPTVSPDAKRVAVSGSLQRGAPNDIWVFDLDGGRRLRLTSDANVEDNPAWTPDGRRILFRKNAVSAHPNERPGDADFYMVDAAGAGPAEPVLENAIRLAEADFSPSGVLIFQQRELEARQFDIYYLPAQEPGAEAQPVPWLDSAFNEAHPQFSPSGKYVAYTSNETGLSQIHVRPFPEGSPVWQVSLEGGNSPRWSPDGRELYWHGDSEGWPLTAADVDFGRSNPFGQPTPLFPTSGFAATYYYDVMPNGQFILLEPDEEDDAESAPPVYFRVIQNWYEQFRRGADAE